MVMLCLQTSCHRCPSALHNRLVTSTPSLSPLSLIHHVRVDASSIAEAPALAAMAYWPGRARTAVARKTNLPHRYAAAATRPLVTVTGIVSLNYPQKTPPERETLAQLRPVDRLHAHRLEFRRVRAPHDPQHDVGPDLRLLDERQ